MTRQQHNNLKSTLSSHRFTILALLALFTLAFTLRMGYPTLVEFKYDEANVVRRAQRIACEGELPVAGVGSSMGAENLPLTLYLLALPMRLWADPVAAVLFTGFLNGLAVVMTYLIGRAYLGHRTGMIAAFLFAVSGWAVLYSRKIWSRTLPLFTLLFVASLLVTLVKDKRWALVGAFVALGALIGLQLEGLAFGPILLITCLVYCRRVELIKPLLVGIALFGLCMAPYVVHDALHGWPNARAFLNYGGGQPQISFDALGYAFSLIGSRGIEGMAGALAPAYRAGLPQLWWIEEVMSILFRHIPCLRLYKGVLGEAKTPPRLRNTAYLAHSSCRSADLHCAPHPTPLFRVALPGAVPPHRHPAL
ncbi:MAG: ArnT family glycosyltransferase [Anaerolineae bacterium]